MTSIQVDASQFARMSNMFAAAGNKAQLALVRAVNHTGNKAVTAMRRVLVDQTGLPMKTLRKALKARRAFNGGAFVIKARGGDVRLKFFRARETRKGVSAAPWNSRQVYPHTFIKGGKFPDRVALDMGGHVFKRAGRSRLPLQSQKSGLFIPTEMVTGQSEAAFYQVVERDLPARLAHELYRVLGS